MGKIINPSIKLKESIDREDYDEINNLEELCVEADNISFKLEIDYKLNNIEFSKNLNHINEFMFYDEKKLIGYIGICDFGGVSLEVSGLVHPDYRRKGIFKRLFSLVKDEWRKRDPKTLLLLSDNKSIAGINFIKNVCDDYDHSEYEMNLKMDVEQKLKVNTITFREATNKDSKEIGRQDSIYFNSDNELTYEFDEKNNGSITYLAEVNSNIIGKVRIEINDAAGGIYGLGVYPEYRGMGYGREILAMAIERLKEKDVKEIFLQVDTYNKNALNLYKSCGFEEKNVMDYYKIMRLKD